MRTTSIVKRETNILRWQGDVPVIGALQYTDRSWFFYCSACKTFHYHPARKGYHEARCVRDDSPFQATGYILEKIQ